MVLVFPHPLRDAIDAELAAVPMRDLKAACERLSSRYLDGDSSGPVSRLPEVERLAYLAVRVPATYAVAARVLDEAAGLLASIAWPASSDGRVSLLDLGAGPGTVLFAGAESIAGLSRAVMVERDPGFIAIGRRLAASLPIASSWITGTWQAMPHDGRFDLVTASFLLAELDPAGRAGLTDAAWDATGSLIVLVEPGTPAGYPRIIEARQRLLARGARLMAPCPHESPCPLSPPDWCHFAVRLARTREHRWLKSANLAYEDEKFAYLIAARAGSPAASARILRRPQFGKRQVRLRLCSSSGVADRLVFKSEQEIYRAARKAGWGNRWTG